MELILIGFLSYNNGMRARKKGQNALLWGFLTFIAIFLMMMVGFLIVTVLFYRGAKDPAALIAFLQKNLIHSIFIWAVGVGGYMIIRYILEKMKPTKLPEKR